MVGLYPSARHLYLARYIDVHFLILTRVAPTVCIDIPSLFPSSFSFFLSVFIYSGDDLVESANHRDLLLFRRRLLLLLHLSCVLRSLIFSRLYLLSLSSLSYPLVQVRTVTRQIINATNSFRRGRYA